METPSPAGPHPSAHRHAMAPQRAIPLGVESARIGVDVEALADQFGVGDGPQVQHRGRHEEAVPLAADVALLEDTGGGQREEDCENAYPRTSATLRTAR